MSVNKFKSHVYVIPEDDDERQIADGFTLHHSVDTRQIQVVSPPGGWPDVLTTFEKEYLSHLRQYPCSHVILLIDFDDQFDTRRKEFASRIPQDVASRVFVIGPKGEAEDLRREFQIGGLEPIGRALANDCDRQESTNWNCSQLAHNEDERSRLASIVRPFLFATPE